MSDRPSLGWPRLLASFFGTGFAPRAPGTVGTLAALPFGWALLSISTPLLAAACVLVSLGGIAVVRRAAGGADHGWIVIDEVAGIWITLLGLAALPGLPEPRGWDMAAGLLSAFALFRLLDITKPGPIGTVDRRHDSLGVMGDDILAGIVGAILLLAGRLLLERLR